MIILCFMNCQTGNFYLIKRHLLEIAILNYFVTQVKIDLNNAVFNYFRYNIDNLK